MPRNAAKAAYKKKLAYNNAYNRENYRSFSIRFDKQSEKKIIKWLEKQAGIKSYITSLIQKDMDEQKELAKAKRKKKTN